MGQKSRFAKAQAHVPEKWTPVFRKGHAQRQDVSGRRQGASGSQKTNAAGWPSVVAFGSNKALDAVAKHKDVSLTAWSMFRRYFFLIHLCPRIFEPDIPDVLWIRAACPFDPVFYFHRILIRAAQERIVRAAGRFPARMLMVVRPFERVQKFAVDSRRMIVSQRAIRRLQDKQRDKSDSHMKLHARRKSHFDKMKGAC
jgi:hypothetical protein